MSLKTRSLEHISRVLAASESFIKSLTVTFNSNMRATSNNDILLFFRQASCWYEQRGKRLLMENDIIVRIQVQIDLKIVLCWCKSVAHFLGWRAHFGVFAGGSYVRQALLTAAPMYKGRVWSGYSIWDSSSGNIPSSVRVAWKPPYRQLPRATPHTGSWNI